MYSMHIENVYAMHSTDAVHWREEVLNAKENRFMFA